MAVDRRPLLAYAQVQDSSEREILLTLKRAAAQAERDIKRLTRGNGIGAAIRRDQMALIRRNLLEEQAKLWDSVGNTVAAGRVRAAAAAVVTNANYDQMLIAAVMGDTNAQVLLDAAQAQAERTVELVTVRQMGYSKLPLSDQVYKTRALSEGTLNRKIDSALARGLSARELADEVVGYINPNTPGGARSAAMRLARTEINNAFHATQVREAQKKPWVTGLKWNLSGSHPKPDECNEYAEEVHMKGGEAGVWDKSEVPAKPHPNCLCFTTPQVVSDEDFVNGFFDGKYDDHIDQVMKDAGYPTTARGKLIPPIAGGSGTGYDPLQGAALRATRENLGLSRPQVAQRANTTVAKLARIELKGGTDEEISAIAQALDMTAPARASSTASPTARALAEPVTNTAQARSTTTWRKLTTDEIADLQRFDDASNQDLRLLEITKRNGHSGRPTLVDRSTFESTPGQELWRGVSARFVRGGNSKQMIRSFQTDEVPFTGLGVYGNGHYFANGPVSGRNVASQYARGSGDVPGAMTRAKLRKGAKIIDDRTAADRSRFDADVWQRRAYDLNGVDKKGFDQAMAMYKMLRDPGRWASLNGYDAIAVTGADYTVVLNRAALIVEDYVYIP